MYKEPKDTTDAIAILEAGLDSIMAASGGNTMDHRQHIGLYTLVHDICSGKTELCSKDVYDKSVSSQGSALPKTPGQNQRYRQSHLLGEDLYHWLDEYLKRHLQSVHAEMITKPKDELVPFYAGQWKRYVGAAKYNAHLFSFLERHWVLREQDEGKTDILGTYPLHLFRWKVDILDSNDSAVFQSLRRHFEKETTEEASDSVTINDVTDSFIALGIRDAGPRRQNSSSSLHSWYLVDRPEPLEDSADDRQNGEPGSDG